MRAATNDWGRVFLHFMSFIVVGVALYWVCAMLTGCAPLHSLGDQRYGELQKKIQTVTATAEAAAAAAGQPELAPILGAAGAAATAIASLWHASSGLPLTKRRKYKKGQSVSAGTQ